MKKFIIKISHILLFILILFQGCTKPQINFDFVGRKVLYSDVIGQQTKLFLLNIDTGKKFVFDDFEEIERNGYHLYNNGNNILVNSYNSKGKIYSYDVLNSEETEIVLPSKYDNRISICNVSLYKSDLYISIGNSIYEYSSNNNKSIKEYNIDSLINQFTVHDKELIAVNYSHFDFDTKFLMLSNIYLYNLKNKSSKEIPYRALIYGWSKDGKKLLFNSGGLKVLDYPSLNVKSIDAIDKDSLDVFSWMRFISNDEIIFAGFPKSEQYPDVTNLYIIDIKSGKIEQITNSNTKKEIKSTDY